MALFRFSISSLIFCLVAISIIESGILNSPNIIIEICSSPFSCQVLPHIFWDSDVTCVHIYNLYIFLIDSFINI